MFAGFPSLKKKPKAQHRTRNEHGFVDSFLSRDKSGPVLNWYRLSPVNRVGCYELIRGHKGERIHDLRHCPTKMSSPGSRRNSCRGAACGSRATFEYQVRRRSSSCSYFASGAQTGDFSVSLSQPIFTVTLRFLLAIDLWLSKRLGVCAFEESAWGSIRPLVRLVEFSGHVIPWLIGTVYTLLRGRSVEEQEIMLNLALGKYHYTIVNVRISVFNETKIYSDLINNTSLSPQPSTGSIFT